MKKDTVFGQLNRRKLLQLSGGFGFASSLAAVSASQSSANTEAAISLEGGMSLKGPYIDLSTPKGNVTALVRMQGDMDTTKQSYGYYGGAVLAVMPNKKIEPIFEFHGFSVARMLPQEDGTWKKVLREVGYYTNLKTGEIMEEWYNPFLDETVRVVPVANDPFNFHLQEIYPKVPFIENQPDIPFILDWRHIGDALTLHMDVHLYYPNRLKPEEWPRESSGPMVRVTELFRTQLSLTDMQNDDLTTVPSRGSWNRVTPWLPWMLMGQKPGHILYGCNVVSGGDDPSFIPEYILKYTQANYPEFMEAPTEWYEPSLSSLENYALQQKPVPMKTEE